MTRFPLSRSFTRRVAVATVAAGLAASMAACAGSSAATASAATTAFAASPARSCRAAPLGDRDLYVRGDFDSWGVDDRARFAWACDRYELVMRTGGDHTFKIADENWSADASFGAPPRSPTTVPTGAPTPLAAGGANLRHAFADDRPARWVLAMATKDAPPTLTITDCAVPPARPLQLYLRGAATQGAALDDFAFRWHCDAYYLNVRLSQPQAFRIADAAWTPAATFGAAAGASLAENQPVTIARGDADPAPLRFDFHGEHTLRLAFDGPGGAPTLTIGPKTFVDGSVPPLTDPVARSVRFDSRDAAYKAPFGAVVAGTPVRYAIDALPGVTKATLVVESRLLQGNEELLTYTEVARVPMTAAPAPDGQHQRWSASFRYPRPGVYGSWFEIEVNGHAFVYANNDQALYWTREKGTGGVGTVVEKPGSLSRIRRFRQTVYAADYHVPDWAQDAVYYYIFPDRFRNGDKSNDAKPGVDRYQDHTVELHAHWNDRPWKPGTGDGSDAVYNNDFFGGDIQGIIDKLDVIRDLGANTLYITPMFEAASNHKYDTADYRHIDHRFGTNDDFTRLCREAARRGIRVLPDTSINHVGSDSIYFDRYGNHKAGGNVGAFQDGRIHPESPYASWFKLDPSQKDPEKQYVGWVGVADLPEVDKTSPGFRDFVYRAPDSIMKTWLDRGAAGWRMDVAPWVPDDFWREWRAEIRHHQPDALTVAEGWFDASKFFTGDMFDSTMNYIFRNAVLDYAGGGDGRAMAAQLEHLREAYPPQAFHALMNLLSTHDVPRSLHVLGDVDGTSSPDEVALAKQKFRLALFFQMTYPGAPAVYYGDEVGVTGGEDPFNRGTYPWEDLGGHPDLALRADVKRLIALRAQHPVLRRGTLLAPLHADAHVVVLARRLGEAWAITATNSDGEARAVDVALPDGAPSTGWTPFPANATPAIRDRVLRITLPARSGALLTAR